MSTGFSKVFQSMWAGSMYGRFEASATFMMLLSLCDADGVVDMTPEAMAGRTGWPVEFIRKGIAELEEPDLKSRTPAAEGRRILQLDDHRDWGWSITNYTEYREKARAEERRAYFRDQKRKQREKTVQEVSGTNVDIVDSPQCQPIAEAEASAEAEAGKSTTARPTPDVDAQDFEDFKNAYPKRSGGQPWSRALKAINARFRECKDLTWSDLIASASRYAAYCEATDKTGTEFVKQASTFCGPDKFFLQSWDLPVSKSGGKTKGQIETSKAFMANTDVQP